MQRLHLLCDRSHRTSLGLRPQLPVPRGRQRPTHPVVYCLLGILLHCPISLNRMLLLCAGVKMRRVAREVGRGLPCAAREQRHGSPSAKGRKAASAGIPCVAPGGSPFARASGGGRSGQRQAWLRGGRLRAVLAGRQACPRCSDPHRGRPNGHRCVTDATGIAGPGGRRAGAGTTTTASRSAGHLAIRRRDALPCIRRAVARRRSQTTRNPKCSCQARSSLSRWSATARTTALSVGSSYPSLTATLRS